MRNADGLWGCVGATLGILVSVFLGIIAALFISFYVQPYKKACDKITANIALEHHWYIDAGCVVRVKPDLWVPVDTYLWMSEKEKDK